MTKKEFLLSRTRDAIDVYKEYGGYTPTFAVLFQDGTTTSIATQFDGLQSKMHFEYMMRKICTNPKVTACAFTSESWASSKAEKKNKRPSECDDREAVIILLYSTRDNIHEQHLYKPNKEGELELWVVSKNSEGRFTNPFLVPCLTNAEKERVIGELQDHVRDSICSFYEQYHYIKPIICFLPDKPGAVSVRQINEKEWKDKNWLRQMISTKCQDPNTIAFLLAYPEYNKVKVILVSEQSQEIFSYETDVSNYTMKLHSRETYKGEFSDFIKGFKIEYCIPGRNEKLLN